MPIPRFHLVELEDLHWFPAVIRHLATDYLGDVGYRWNAGKVLLERGPAHLRVSLGYRDGESGVSAIRRRG